MTAFRTRVEVPEQEAQLIAGVRIALDVQQLMPLPLFQECLTLLIRQLYAPA